MNKTITVSALRSNLKKALLKIRKGESIVITSRGKSIGMITPMQEEKVEALKLMKKIRASARIGDVVSPISADWEAES